ncbi:MULTISPECIES: serine/threonine-protein kinase [unclassified Arthrobacter]|uniref:serine/threonine-protein kinase n=1 Tax=unclassified Arthrobacter TaxID=235627 RepID=UPI001490C3CA|nr:MULTISPECIES: serine/threonine-protein kinase [unclassified Arthrobacter]MBE0009567.1 serine/threonine protein kinase [Arthrobacter sp. AET 35A]NOJ63317.1 serine/threonine protein kinase [Arthrobacter sp. 147(2020)]
MDSTPTGEGPLNDSSAHPPSVPGYRCERLLGTGGSAAVWLVRNDQGASYALKVLDSAGRGDLGVDVVRREQLMLSRFTHEHLLALHEVVQTAQGTALRMDYAAGGSLLNLVSVRGPLSPGEVVTVLTPMAQVLAYLHDEGAVHGDVAPGNILFTELGKPLLADLGIARLLGEGSHVATGTPGFQETRDHNGLNTEADLFALAAVGWFALTGRIPGPASQRPPLSLLVPDTPEALVELISWGLESEPEDRPTAIEFARAVQRTATAAPLDLVAAVHPDVAPSLMTRRPDPGEEPEKKRRRRRRPASVVAPVPRRSTSRSAAPAGSPGRRAAPPSQRRVRGVTAGLFIALALGVVAIGAVSVSAPDPVEAGRGGAVNLPSGTVPSGPPPIPSPTTAPPRPASAVGPTARASDTAPDVLPEALAGTDPLEVLPHLSRVRERAFETADPALLRHVFVPESAAMAADEEVVVELAARGHVLTGLSSDLANLERIDIPPGDAKDTAAGNTGTGNTGTVAIAATATTSGYAEATVGGRTQREVPQEVSQQLVFVLQRIADRWLIREVREP